MGIGAIGNEISYYGLGEKKIKDKAVSDNSFSDKMVETSRSLGKAAALHGTDDESDDIAIFSLAEIVSGSSVSVYKTPDTNSENPVYKVKIWDESGNMTEHVVDVSKVNPKDCNAIEMYAYTADLKESGKGSFEDTVLKAVITKTFKDDEASTGSWSFSAKTDWVKTVNDIMQSIYDYGDLKGYMDWKKFLELLDK